MNNGNPYKIIGWLTAQMNIHAHAVNCAAIMEDSGRIKAATESMNRISEMDIHQLEQEVKKMELS